MEPHRTQRLCIAVWRRDLHVRWHIWRGLEFRTVRQNRGNTTVRKLPYTKCNGVRTYAALIRRAQKKENECLKAKQRNTARKRTYLRRNDMRTHAVCIRPAQETVEGGEPRALQQRHQNARPAQKAEKGVVAKESHRQLRQ
ncbi:unnamed protein product, partial [Ectocarpus sp. 4 AP-2014]